VKSGLLGPGARARENPKVFPISRGQKYISPFHFHNRPMDRFGHPSWVVAKLDFPAKMPIFQILTTCPPAGTEQGQGEPCGSC